MGETVILPGMSLEDYGVVENHLLNLRRDQLIEVGAKMCASLKERGLDDLAEAELSLARQDAREVRSIPHEEAEAWMNTYEGAAFTIWILLDRSHPGKYSLEQCRQAIAEKAKANANALEKLNDKRRQAAGTDTAGNSTGPTEESNPADGKGQPSS
jgi:hypothetical protein